MPRQARLDAPGTLHHVIVRGIEKRRIVDDRKDGENFVTRMGEIALAEAGRQLGVSTSAVSKIIRWRKSNSI